MIEHTMHDLPPANFTDLQRIIRDLDLLGLSTDYRNNCDNVKAEFGFLSQEEWRKGRMAFLKKFLSRDTIYHTELYKDKYESQARTNLQNEYDFLLNELAHTS
jgi:predicted metal-dependent HD superfamily phosphohydrolase